LPNTFLVHTFQGAHGEPGEPGQEGPRGPEVTSSLH